MYFCLVLFAIASNVFAESQIICPKLTGQQYPALLFTTESGENSCLYAASFEGSAVHMQKILSEKYIGVTQLDKSIFLISATSAARSGKLYAIDLSKGTSKLLFESTRISCLRSEPQRKTAMLIDSYPNKANLIELNLETFETQMRYELSKDLYNGIGPRMKISPDFKHIAYADIKQNTTPSSQSEHILRFLDLDSMIKISPDIKHTAHTSTKQNTTPPRQSEYILRVLDLDSMMPQVLDSKVPVHIPNISSFRYGEAAFEWINNNEILYLNVLQNEPNDDFNGMHIFKTVNIKTKNISQPFRTKLRLALDGGSLQTNPLNGQLIYRGTEILDLGEKRLTSKYLPFSSTTDIATRKTQVLDGNNVLYSGSAYSATCCISPSGKNFAYAINENESKLYVKTEGLKEPIKFTEGNRCSIKPEAWIEN